MRYVVLGAGGIGGTIGGRVFEHGHDVVLVARGAHLEALRDRGLELRSPQGTVVLPIPAVADASELALGSADVVLLATKTQDTVAALATLDGAPDVTVVCAQNGVQNERMALRRVADVHGMCVALPASHLEPGVVECYAAPRNGILDVGRYPTGTDATDERIAADLEGSGFIASAAPDVMARKYGKLLMNLANVLEAAAAPEAWGDLYDRARTEALECFEAAGIEVDTGDDPRREQMRMTPIDGRRRSGGSTWQSLAKGSGSTEADYLNGEVVLLGRLHGVPTPVNEGLQRLARHLATTGAEPGSMDRDSLVDAVDGQSS
ncbi:ketopantoate reductase family protein [Dermatobacter hominis]|uniref:ketopantoate reductase family protein n=1 Tax=Dermatobacter hominis TaxID=2884263 RepID=UPI001D114B21|nr:2-dehydropantoate 2-reductase [Dermatobacter hominis]UDY37053.1 2-dehydropantoate 2-reductase [Dermatobacter hominis]